MVPKFLGRDCELSTTGQNGKREPVSDWQVTRDILGQIGSVFDRRGIAVWSRSAFWQGNWRNGSPYSADCLRHWPANGQCYYADMCHAEVCTAMTKWPTKFAAQSISTLLAVEAARELAELAAADGTRYALSATNADAADPAISWGTHLNVTISTELWEDLLRDHVHPARLAQVASVMAAVVPFFGAGYLLPLKDGSVIYSLSGRAHHLSRVHTLPTTTPFVRGLLNERREPHGQGQERLHLIAFDFALVGAALLASFLQCALAAAEEGFCGMILYDPVRACRQWSWCLDTATGRLPLEAALVNGRKRTLPRYVRELAQQFLSMCQAGLIDEAVAPEAPQMLAKIIDLTHYAEEGSLDRCARHLDWAAKLMFLVGSGLDLSSGEARLLDHDFANTDPRRGTFWQLWESGLVDPLVTREQAERCLRKAPEESRDWGRGQLIQRFGEQMTGVDWAYVELDRGHGRWEPRLRIDMPHPESLNRAALEPLLDQVQTVQQLEVLLAQAPGHPARATDPITNIPDQLA